MPNIQTVDIHTFLELAQTLPVLDARSEGEWEQGHITHSISFPILNNEERALVGTCYKKQGHDPAVILGYQLAGPKFAGFVTEAQQRFPGKQLLLHCFRGGLRSKIMAWVLHSAGFDITLLKGGYKAYRQYVLETVATPLQLRVIGGYTGSGKTAILQQLAEKGEQIIDIEMLANHRGSAYGAIDLPPQPTNEQFENNLADCIRKLDSKRHVWIEDESRKTGTVVMPEALYLQKLSAPLYLIQKSKEERIAYIKDSYGRYPKDLLIQSTQKLERKLGNLRMRTAVEAIEQNNPEIWLSIVLEYYDETYEFGINRRSPDQIKPISGTDESILNQLLNINQARPADISN